MRWIEAGSNVSVPKETRELALVLLVSFVSHSDVIMKVTTRVALRCYHVNHKKSLKRLKQRKSKEDFKSFVLHFHRRLTSKQTRNRNDPTHKILGGEKKKNIHRKVREAQQDIFQEINVR